ncbi:hypothetical protein NBRC111894_206 [Sporolactobacillus inulinus]|uniref:Uncharacterized protein n=1 Tax=Sporolactobacillus inulinus TaxID=2078 RepID=A0A4Y1Z6I3_9BACL|nr:hypothetical protein NBRC111894_206 [Sporolactobacillus inulinus]
MGESIRKAQKKRSLGMTLFMNCFCSCGKAKIFGLYRCRSRQTPQ